MSSGKWWPFCLGLNVLNMSSEALLFRPPPINSLEPDDAYMRQWSGSSLVRVMDWFQTSDKSLPEPMTYRQLGIWEKTSRKY